MSAQSHGGLRLSVLDCCVELTWLQTERNVSASTGESSVCLLCINSLTVNYRSIGGSGQSRVSAKHSFTGIRPGVFRGLEG